MCQTSRVAYRSGPSRATALSLGERRDRTRRRPRPRHLQRRGRGLNVISLSRSSSRRRLGAKRFDAHRLKKPPRRIHHAGPLRKFRPHCGCSPRNASLGMAPDAFRDTLSRHQGEAIAASPVAASHQVSGTTPRRDRAATVQVRATARSPAAHPPGVSASTRASPAAGKSWPARAARIPGARAGARPCVAAGQ